MTIFVMCLNPLLNALEKKLTGIKIGRGTKTKFIAYADDVSIIVSKLEDISILNETLRIYEEATGAKRNARKSNALALSSWKTSKPIMDGPYCEEMKTLGFAITNTIHSSVRRSWNLLSARIRAEAQDIYQRALHLEHRIRCTHKYMLARVWYMTQNIPPAKKTSPK